VSASFREFPDRYSGLRPMPLALIARHHPLASDRFFKRLQTDGTACA
jgi:hypothetical protein